MAKKKVVRRTNSTKADFEVIEELEEQLSVSRDEVKDLKEVVAQLEQQIESDKGIPDDPHPRIAELESQLTQYQHTNNKLAEENKELKKNQVLHDGDTDIELDNLDPMLVAQCINRITNPRGGIYSMKSFKSVVSDMVVQGKFLASEIMKSQKDNQ